MAMNSPPSSRNSTASDPITPMSDNALEIGCLCSTRFIAHATAIAAKIRNRIASILRRQGDHQAGEEQIRYGDGEHESPREPHQLIVAKARQRAANPDIKKKNDADFRGEPEQRQKNGRDDGN